MTARSQSRALFLFPEGLRPLAAFVLLAVAGMARGSLVSSGNLARRRRHGRHWLSAAFVLVTTMAFAPTRALAASTDPVVAKVLRCHAAADHDYPQNSCPGGGYAFDGWGSTPAQRSFSVFLGFEVAELGDDPGQALDNTSRIELCYASEGQQPTCPGTGEWLIYDAAQQVGELPDEEDVAAMPSSAVQTLGISLPDVDWDDPQQASRGFFVRINGSSQTPLDALLSGSSCLNFSRLAFDPADPRVAVFGPPRDTYNPFDQLDASYDVCSSLMESCASGSFVDWCVDAGPVEDRAEWTRQVFSSIATGHIDQLQMQVDPGNQVVTWVNGTIGGVQQPYRVMMIPKCGAFSAGSGYASMKVQAYQGYDPNAPPNSTHPVTITAHEMCHAFMPAWGRVHPGGCPHYGGVHIGEAVPEAQQSNLCLYDFPNAPPTDCIAAGKLSGTVSNHAATFLTKPTIGLLTADSDYRYDQSAFWRYVFEQFSHPKGGEAHPGGTESQLRRALDVVPTPELNEPDAALNARLANEGLDFLGLYADTVRNAILVPTYYSTLDAIDAALQEHLGRGLQDVVFDAWTAWLLKDFNDTGNESWRYEWIGNFNEPLPAELSRPNAVPPSLIGSTGDGLTRMRRVHDPWGSCTLDPQTLDETCTKYASLQTLAFGGGVSGPTPAALTPYGAAVMSVAPDTTSVTNWVGKNLRVRSAFNSPYTRARIFKIQRDGTDRLVVPMCGVPPEHTCAKPLGPGGFTLDELVPIDADTEEVLLVAGAGATADQAFWSFGPVEPTLTLLEPTASMPAYVGHPEMVDGRQPFLVSLAARDADNHPINLNEDEISIDILDENEVVRCTLDSTLPEFQFLGLSGGHVLMVLTLPPGCYLPWSQMPPTEELTLVAHAKGLEAFRTQAIVASTFAFEHATTLVVDKSGSMADLGGTKLDAAKIVLKAMLHAMMPGDGNQAIHEAALVAFRGYADTVFPLNPVDETTIDTLEAIIDGVTAVGSTSIGDGALEAQSILAEAYDDISYPDQTPIQAMIIASDGLNTHPAWPADYYFRSHYSDPEADHQDDNGPWYQDGPLQRFPRLDEELPLPRVSTIAIGQDADLAELQALAYYGLGSFMYLPGPESSTTLMSATLDFADSFGESFNGLSGYERITSARVNGAVPGAMPVIQVEDGALELRVSVVSATEPTTELELMAPDGQIHTFTSATSNAQTAVFRVLAPRAGAWTFTGPGGSTTSNPSVFVEATVRSQVHLFASADVAIVHEVGGAHPPDSGRWVGTDVVLRAAPTELGPMLGCAIDAHVTLPLTKQVLTIPLHDDGEHDDGAPLDGNYGALLTQTGEPGLYDVRFEMSCISSVTATNVERQVRRGVTLHSTGDEDDDGLHDPWEIRFGLDPQDPQDAVLDLDGDGLDNLGELRVGTNPWVGDTDGSGEGDGSEVAEGRNPRDPTDDLSSSPDVTLLTGNGLVGVELGMATTDVEILIERGTSEYGPFEPYAETGYGEHLFLDEEVTNGQPVCYRTRAIRRTSEEREAGEMLLESSLGALGILAGNSNPDLSNVWCSDEGLCVVLRPLALPHGAFSSWSTPTCTTPATDPDRPMLGPVQPTIRAGGPDELIAELQIHDPSQLADGADDPFDRKVVPSGVLQIRFDVTPTFQNTEWFEIHSAAQITAPGGPQEQPVTLSWDPLTSELAIDLSATPETMVFVQLRDGAGNMSIVGSFPVSLP